MREAKGFCDFAFLDLMNEAPDEFELKRTASKVLNELGFDGFAYMRFRKGARPDGTTDYREDWRSHYLEQGFLYADLTIDKARLTTRPFTWEESMRGGSISSRHRLVFSEGRDFGIAEGASIPIHGPGEEFGNFSISANISGISFHKRWQQHKYQLHLMGLYFHEGFTRIFGTRVDETIIQLSPREKECLLWTSRGKTAWEVSEILSVSSYTVDSHLRNAMDKLDTFSKHHAVVKAVLCGLIHP